MDVRNTRMRTGLSNTVPCGVPTFLFVEVLSSNYWAASLQVDRHVPMQFVDQKEKNGMFPNPYISLFALPLMRVYYKDWKSDGKCEMR